jgi:hypothetical protein
MPQTPQTPPLPAAGRAISAATSDAVAAARAGDVPAFDEAVGRLAAAEPEQVRVVLGVVVRSLLEDLHPDGVSGDDLLELIKSCARTSYAWYPGVDLGVLVVVLTGALGVHEPEQEPRQFTPLDVARHAPLFIAELLTTGRPDPAAPRPLKPYFDAAFLEISRSELNELP